MANNYFDGTGVLVLDRVTPVIATLFGGFKLDGAYPGNGEAYIARLSESHDPQWDDVLDALTVLADSLGLTPLAEPNAGIKMYLRVLAKHFGTEDREDLEHLIESHDFDDRANLEALFLIATCFDDGHGLKAIKFEGAWYCDKARLFEFGGEGMFISREVSLVSTSSRALALGQDLREALLSHGLDQAVAWITCEVNSLLASITDDETRAALRLKLGRLLAEDTQSP
jgi:hypothetical protein